MANTKSKTCGRAADAGGYCSSCAADIMAKAFNPFYGGKRKKGASMSCPSDAHAPPSVFR